MTALRDDLPTSSAAGPPDSEQARLTRLGDAVAAHARAAALSALATRHATEGRHRVQAGVVVRSRRSGWTALTMTVLCRSVLAMLAGLLLWSLAPDVLGWHSTVVQTGSMQPRLQPGDVVVSRPVPSNSLRRGQVLLVADPDHPGRLRLHRLAQLHGDGTLTLRGDANPAADSTPVRRSAVRGVASLRIPYVGLPELWVRQHDLAALILLGGALGAIGLGACAYRDPTDDTDDTDDTDPTDDQPTDRSDAADGDGAAPPGRRSRLSRRVAVLGVLSLTLAGAGIGTARHAAAAGRFNRTSSDSANSWSALPYFTCQSAVQAANPYFYYRLNEASGTTAADASGNVHTGTYQSAFGVGVTYGAADACARDTGTAVTLNGTTGWISTSSAVANPTVFTEEIWFKTTTTKGGELIGFANTQLLTPTSFDRHLYLANSGQLVFGVYPGSVKTVVSPKSYNDGSWHLADAVLSGAGMQLYVDGSPVAGDATVTTAENYTGYWRIGYNNLSNWGTTTPSSSYVSATLDDAAVYSTALTATQIANHYAAA